MTNLKSMSRGMFKRKSSKRSSRTMANNKRRKSRSKNSSSGSGKILGIKVPVVGKVFGNPTVKKALMGAGAVSLAISLAALVNNPTVNKALNNKLVRLGLATAAGDVVGGGIQLLKESPEILRRTGGGNGNGTPQGSLIAVSGGGVA